MFNIIDFQDFRQLQNVFLIFLRGWHHAVEYKYLLIGFISESLGWDTYPS